MHTLYLALGTNLGNRHALMQEAIVKINEKIGTVVCQSSFYETEPWGFDSEHLFLNACVKVETHLSPMEVLATSQAIEKLLGRQSKSVNGQYADRPMDIDILFYDDLHIQTSELTIPHPKMFERPFVMNPLKEICSNVELFTK